MYKVTIKPQWQVQAPNGEPALVRLVDLLVGIHETGSLGGGGGGGGSFSPFAPGVV